MSTSGIRPLRAGTERSPIVPYPSTPQGGRRRFVQTQLLVTNLASGAFAAQTARFRVDIPSCRLHAGVSVDFKPDTTDNANVAQSGVNAWLFALDAWRRTEDGLLVRSNPIVSAVPGPTTYEHAGTIVDQWRGSFVVPGAGVGTTLVPGKWFVTATWEPTAGYTPDDNELAHLFQACHLQIDQAALTSQGG